MSTYLSDFLGTEVHIGRIDVGLLNQMVLSDIEIKDHKGQKCLQADKVACSINVFSLLKGEINLSSLQLFGLKAHIYKEQIESPLNIQFIIDKLSPKKKEKEQKFHLEHLVIRNGAISYDILTSPNTPDLFNPSHLCFENLNVIANIHDNNPETLSFTLTDFHVNEVNSNNNIQSCSGNFQKKQNRYHLYDFDITTNNCNLHSNHICYTPLQESLSVEGDMTISNLNPCHFSTINPSLQNLDENFNLQCDFKCADKNLHINNLTAQSSSCIKDLDCDVIIDNIKDKDSTFKIDVRTLSVSPKNIFHHLGNTFTSSNIVTLLSSIEQLEMTGSIHQTPSQLAADVLIETPFGRFSADGIYTKEKTLIAHLQSESLGIHPIIPNIPVDNLSTDLDVLLHLNGAKSPFGEIKGVISNIAYNGTNIQDTSIDGKFNSDGFNGSISINDPKLKCSYKGEISGINSHNYRLNADLSIEKFTPSTFGLNGTYSQNTYTFQAKADLQGSNLDNLSGSAYIRDLLVSSPSETYSLKELALQLSHFTNNEKSISISSDIINGQVDGNFKYDNLIQSLKAAFNPVLGLTGMKKNINNNNNFTFNINVSESTLLQPFIKKDIEFEKQITLSGAINSPHCKSDVHISAPSINIHGVNLENIVLDYVQEDDSSFKLLIDGNYPQQGKTYVVHADASCRQNIVDSDIQLIIDQDRPVVGNLHCHGVLSQNSPNDLLANLTIDNSDLTILNQHFDIHANSVDLYKDKVAVNNLKIANADKSVVVTGILSQDPEDKLMAEINGTQIKSLFELFNLNTKLVDGFLYGHCDIYNVFSSPKINANLTINDLMYKTELVGLAQLRADWDQERNGIHLQGSITKDNIFGIHGQSFLDGYIYSEDKQLDFSIDCKDTDANILNAMLGRTFKNIVGRMNGNVRFKGPFNDIKIYGHANVDAALTVKATKVTYNVHPEDQIFFDGEQFIFNNNRIIDKDGNTNIINGWVTHHNLKDFNYEFNINLQNILLYEEEAFNNDKFRGKIYGSGTCNIKGHDGYPLTITADITPSKGSEFAYDSSTPDAISQNNFISYQSGIKDSIESNGIESTSLQSNIAPAPYRGDIFMEITIHMNHNCPLKLKMDNYDDGYIVVYGTGVLQAKYYNKRGFTLNGTYNIQDGKYKLYLQDIIYRDLMIQEGSNVIFNGNPFDADIHLICSHTINSVPLSDLTNAVYTQNNRVKVNCMLDITGKLGNMNFKFDLNLPNVSDETRQIVRSYISTEEEMNKQMIYLLGFGRFYTDEYARATGETTSNQAVNSLLSSTLSGQINQILSNAIGPESNWNFGTGITTGERGWEDMDLEGTLSGKLLDDRLLINGNFGYRDNSMTNNSGFVGDFDVKWRLASTGNTYIKAYNLTNDRYFTKSTLNTQGIGLTYQKDFESWKDLFKKKKKKSSSSPIPEKSKAIIPNDESNILIIHNDTLK